MPENAWQESRDTGLQHLSVGVALYAGLCSGFILLYAPALSRPRISLRLVSGLQQRKTASREGKGDKGRITEGSRGEERRIW